MTGSNFDTNSIIQWNGAARPTDYASPTELRATIQPEDIETAGTVSITVVTQGPGGGVSNPLTFEVLNLGSGGGNGCVGLACPPAPSATPEADSVLLFGSGLVCMSIAAGKRSRFRSQRSRQEALPWRSSADDGGGSRLRHLTWPSRDSAVNWSVARPLTLVPRAARHCVPRGVLVRWLPAALVVNEAQATRHVLHAGKYTSIDRAHGAPAGAGLLAESA